MRKIDKAPAGILSKQYKDWVDDLEKNATRHPKSTGYARYANDVRMELLLCQKNVCAYTEICLCNGKYTQKENWAEGVFVAPADYDPKDYFGELDHFDPSLKKDKYWLWENLFMIDSDVNGKKLNKPVVSYLKPDLEEYSPEQYFDYDETTHQFIPNPLIEDPNIIKDIRYMIKEVLYLNHGTIVKAREEFINNIRLRRQFGLDTKPVDQFFTATEWTLNGKPDVV